MSERSKDKIRRDELLARVPAEATKIQVKTEKGHIKWKDPQSLADTDLIQVNGDDQPIVMMGKMGRRKKIVVAPTTATIAEILKLKEEALAVDPVLKVAKANPESPDVLHQIMLELGEEAASLEFVRKEAERNGHDSSGMSIRRVTALKAMGDTWLKRKEQLASREIDLTSPVFQTLFNYILETFKNSMTSCEIQSEQIETVFAKFASLVDDENWEAEARNRMKHIS